MSPGFGHRSRMFPSIFSAHFLLLHVQSACGSARVLPASEASVPVHPELQRWPLRALSPPPPITPTATVIQRLLFFPVFAWCAQSATVTARRGPAEPDHTEPCVVLIQLPTPRLDNSPWREAPEKWIRPLVLTFFPVHLPPGQERPWLSQLSSEPSPSSTGSILLASILQQDVDYFPAARFTSLIQRHLWSQSWNGRWHVTGVSHEEDHLMCRRLKPLTLIMDTFSSRNQSRSIWADSTEPSHQSNTTLRTRTTPLQRKHCRSLTHEGKSESLLASNKSV